MLVGENLIKCLCIVGIGFDEVLVEVEVVGIVLEVMCFRLVLIGVVMWLVVEFFIDIVKWDSYYYKVVE